MIENQQQTPGPQPYPSSQPLQPAPKKKNTALTCAIIAIIVLCVGSIILIAGFGGLAFLSGGNPEGLSVTPNVPQQITMGQPFEVKLLLNNNGSKDVKIDTVKLPNQLLEYAALTKMVPAYSTIDKGTDASSYKLDLSLKPGESKEIALALKPLKTGSITGDIQLLSGLKTVSNNVALNVVEAKAQVPTAAPQTSNATQAPVATGGPVTSNSKVPYQAVVEIQAYVDYEGELVKAWWGSGTIVSPDGYILTNAHVVADTKNFAVKDLIVAMTDSPDREPEQRYHAEIVQLDTYMDIAVIKITKDLSNQPVSNLNLPTVPLGNSDELGLNDELVILGYPGIGGTTITLTDGRVGGFTAQEPYGNRAFIKTSATFAGGNSGGLAVNSKGEMIGIPTQLGYGGEDQYADCRRLVDTNGDGTVNESDTCIPTGGFINALRPINLAVAYINAAKAGEVNTQAGTEVVETYEVSGDIYNEDDFSDTATGWPESSDEFGSYAYVDGEYHIKVAVANQVLWASFGETFDDTESTIDVRPVTSSGDGSFGILCRYQDKDNFYGLEVSEDGYYSIWRRQNDEYVFLSYWEYSDLIPQHQPFTITGSCIGDTLTLAVNGKMLAQTIDTTFQGGDLGFFASTYENAGLVAGFDNYVVRKK